MQDGCETANFDFINRGDATAAMAALGSQVLQDTALGQFASDPTLTFGCSSNFVCESVLAYSPAIGVGNGATLQNYNAAIGGRYGATVVDLTKDTGTDGALNYVRFALVQAPSAAPEPASWAMMIGGFGMIGAALRRRPRTHIRLA